jgi:hypothetical protein
MILMKLFNFRRLKSAVGHDFLYETTNLLKIKFTLNKIGTGNNWPNGATETDLGDRETVPGHQVGAVVPDDVTVHEIERPETHD